jgi:hypothetical protein
MGETQNRAPEEIAIRLSDAMQDMLRHGFYNEGSATVVAGSNSGTRKALVRRGLIAEDGRWTALGREVARVLDDRVKTIDQLHEMAIDEMRTSLELRAARDAAERRAAAGAEQDKQRLGLSPERIEFRVTPSWRGKIAAAVERNRAAGQHVANMLTGRIGRTVRRGDRTVTLAIGGVGLEMPLSEFVRNWEPALPCDGCGELRARSKMSHERVVDAGSSESVYRCGDCGPLNAERITTTTAARRAETEPAPAASPPFRPGDQVRIADADPRVWEVAEVVPGY